MKDSENVPLSILVVEDKPEHIQDAKDYFGGPPRSSKINVSYASTFIEAKAALDMGNLEGIISDLFFPAGGTRDEREELAPRLWPIVDYLLALPCVERNERRVEEVECYRDATRCMPYDEVGHLELPFGALLAYDAKRKNIPIVICTDGHHHSSRIGPLAIYFSAEGVLFVDNNLLLDDYGIKYEEHEKETPRKDWEWAYLALAVSIEKKKINERSMLREYRDLQKLRKLQADVRDGRIGDAPDDLWHDWDGPITSEALEKRIRQDQRLLEESGFFELKNRYGI